MLKALLRPVLEFVTPPPVVVPVIVTKEIRLVTIKDIAVFLGQPEEWILSQGSQIGKAMAARYRELTGEEPLEVWQWIHGKERKVFGYRQEFLPELAKVWRD